MKKITKLIHLSKCLLSQKLFWADRSRTPFTAKVTDVENKVQEATCLINGGDSSSPVLSLRHNPFLVYVHKIDKRIIHRCSQSVIFWHRDLKVEIFSNYIHKTKRINQKGKR